MKMESRWEDKTLLYSWIKNSAEVLATGDAYANTLFESFNKSPMPAQALNDEQITAILAYISTPPAAPVAAAASDGALAAQGPQEPGIPYWVVMLGAVILLFILVSMLKACLLCICIAFCCFNVHSTAGENYFFCII